MAAGPFAILFSMAETTSLPLFLGSVVAISMTGVMMPGPTTAVTITNGIRHKEAGALVALGHGIIEVPLMVLIYFGFAHYFELDSVKIGVGLAGGAVLLWMALNIFKTRPLSLDSALKYPGQGPLAGGIVTTVTNPYFYVWWATIGAALLVDAHDHGKSGLVAMGAIHWLCDAAWLLLLSWVVFKSKRLWTPRVYQVVFGLCSLVLAGFGAWFIASAVDLAATG